MLGWSRCPPKSLGGPPARRPVIVKVLSPAGCPFPPRLCVHVWTGVAERSNAGSLTRLSRPLVSLLRRSLRRVVVLLWRDGLQVLLAFPLLDLSPIAKKVSTQSGIFPSRRSRGMSFRRTSLDVSSIHFPRDRLGPKRPPPNYDRAPLDFFE